VASLQNGVGNEETLAEFGGKVIGGVVMTGFIRKDKDAVQVIASAGPMKIGRFPSGGDEAVSRLAELMNRAGIRTVTVPRIRDDVWAKNLINATVSSLCTVVGVQCGGLDPVHSLAVMRGIAAETFAVTREIGVTLPWSDEAAFCVYIRDEILRPMADHPVSMLQDIQAGKLTEIDHINGPIIDLGKKYGIPTPYNTCITGLVHCIEASETGYRPAENRNETSRPGT
jgi:2-dehydropantoate 2-reductase